MSSKIQWYEYRNVSMVNVNATGPQGLEFRQFKLHAQTPIETHVMSCDLNRKLDGNKL